MCDTVAPLDARHSSNACCEWNVSALPYSQAMPDTATRHPPWVWDELVLACDMVVQNGWRSLEQNDARVVELSALLQTLPLHPVANRPPGFRNPSLISLKSFDIATAHPDYSGTPRHGGATDKLVISDFWDRPAKMHAEAQALRAFASLRSGLPLSAADRINKLIHDLLCEPELLFAVDSREFECLVAEILCRRGYNVQVTRQSRDGGVDIYASRLEPNGLHGLYFVQCKRQSKRNRVGVRPVRELYGVVCARNATGGIVITTSFFTSPAINFQSTAPNRIALQDNSAVMRWLRETGVRLNKATGFDPVKRWRAELCT